MCRISAQGVDKKFLLWYNIGIMNKDKIKTLAWRLGKGFLAGAISTMTVVVPTLQYSTEVTWSDLGMWIGSLSLAGVIGGLTGLILAADKFRRL